MDKMEILRAKELRGEIINILYRSFGTVFKVGTLKTLLRNKCFSADLEIRKALEYLGGAGKQFVVVTVDSENFWDSLALLLPLGVNLAEGDIEDVGVIINE